MPPFDNELVPLVERELRQLAGRYMRGGRPGHVLQPTALVNEACIRLLTWRKVDWQNRAHFLAMAARNKAGFSADGAELWFSAIGQRPRLVPQTGGSMRPFLTENARALAWFTDGTRVAYFAQQDNDDVLMIAESSGADGRPIDVTVANGTRWSVTRPIPSTITTRSGRATTGGSTSCAGGFADGTRTIGWTSGEFRRPVVRPSS
jgi:hypothetical protein